MLKKQDRVSISKFLALILRHDPAQFGVELDKEGWVDTARVLEIVQKRNQKWRDVSEATLIEINENNNKKRYDFKDGKIRALYGHSIAERIEKEPRIPPVILFHGTAPQAAQSILKEGIRPMGRQYAHLSDDRKTALNVGSRKDKNTVLLIVRALDAHNEGHSFYLGNEDTWLADFVPPEYVSAESSNGATLTSD